MTDTNNGWPDKPGVPMNPEKDGWHWVVSFDAEKTIVFWHGENQGNEGYWDGYPLWIAQDWTYLGLVLLPDEASALQKRADQSALGYAREARRADLFKFLHKRDVAALQARVAELQAALQSIVEYCDDPYLPYYKDIMSKARAALEGGKKDDNDNH